MFLCEGFCFVECGGLYVCDLFDYGIVFYDDVGFCGMGEFVEEGYGGGDQQWVGCCEYQYFGEVGCVVGDCLCGVGEYEGDGGEWDGELVGELDDWCV